MANCVLIDESIKNIDKACTKYTFGHGILQQQGLVSEGRNTATALFPERDATFYVTADVAIRARRRFETHQQDGRDVPYDQVLQDMIARDERDKTRTTNPLAPAPDAVILDTSALSIEAACIRCNNTLTYRRAPNGPKQTRP